MKKIVSFLIMGLLLLPCLTIKAQQLVFSSDFETWYGNAPAGWEGSVSNIAQDSVLPYTTSAHSPTHACELINSSTTHKRFTTQAINCTVGTIYNISYWVRGHGSIRFGFYDKRTSGYGYVYHTFLTENSTTWTHIIDTVICKNTKWSQFIWDVKSTVSDLDNIQIDDIAIYTGPTNTNPMLAITYPYNGGTYYGSTMQINFYTMNFILGNSGGGVQGHVKYTVDGGSAQNQYSSNPIQLTGLSAGKHKVFLELVNTSGSSLSPRDTATIHFTINLTPPNPVSIYAIQYTTASSPANSPLNGTVVTTTGVVTGAYTMGYFIQTQNASGPWNGVYVNDAIYQPSQGDLVTITGQVEEYYGYTEITYVSGFTKVSSGNALPAPAAVNTANLVDTIVGEPYEGTLVTITNVPCSRLANSYYEWQVLSGGDTANIGPLFYQFYPSFATYYDITGVVYLNFGYYYIEPRNAGDIKVHVVGIKELEAESNNLSIYPNPSQDMVYLKNIEGAKMIRLSDITGQTVQDIGVSGNSASLNISRLSPGVYFVSLMNDMGIIKTGKIMKD